MMKESIGSLRAYFILVGALALFAGIAAGEPQVEVGIVSRVVPLTIGAAYVYFGIRVSKYLKTSPQLLVGFIAATIALGVINSLMAQEWVGALITALIGWYLIHNVNKLSVASTDKENTTS